MDSTNEYQIGDRVRLTDQCAAGYGGEPAKVVQVKRDEQGNVLSLDNLLDESNETTRGTTVYPGEVEPALP
jgi:hypothetical protein